MFMSILMQLVNIDVIFYSEVIHSEVILAIEGNGYCIISLNIH